MACHGWSATCAARSRSRKRPKEASATRAATPSGRKPGSATSCRISDGWRRRMRLRPSARRSQKQVVEEDYNLHDDQRDDGGFKTQAALGVDEIGQGARCLADDTQLAG